MNKKIIMSISIILLTIVLGVGIYKSDAAKSNPELTYEDIKDIAESQYAGTITEIELERKHGKNVYEVELTSDEKQYELKLDANTGEVVVLEEKQIEQNTKLPSEQKDKSKADNARVKEDSEPTLIMGMDEAIAFALQEFSGTVTEAELDREDGRFIYEIEIKSNGVEADIEVDAQTGEILIIEIDD